MGRIHKHGFPVKVHKQCKQQQQVHLGLQSLTKSLLHQAQYLVLVLDDKNFTLNTCCFWSQEVFVHDVDSTSYKLCEFVIT